MTLRCSLVVILILLGAAGCSVGQGTGDVKSDGLFAHECWGTPIDATHAKGAPYDMLPNFFAAVPFHETLQMRIQRGTDLTEVSDGLSVLVDDVNAIRAAIPPQVGPGAGDAGATGGKVKWRVAIPAGVIPPGSPSVPPPDLLADPPIVHMALYLERSCHNQNVVLYGVDGYVTFDALFDADPDETRADEKLTDATFDVSFGDLHDAPFGGYAGDVPVGLRSRVTGRFRFYFERGQPGQPFP